MNRAVFLDRDGTINEEMGYINHLSRFKIFSFAFDAIKILNQLGLKVIVITNQSGLARGYFSEDVLDQVHHELLEQAKAKGAKIEKIYYCPHHKNAIVEKYKKDCDCRKPKPGMIINARDEYDLVLEKSYLVSDRYKDIQFGQNHNVKSIMVKTGYGLGEYTHQQDLWARMPDYICENVLHAAQLIEKIETSLSN